MEWHNRATTGQQNFIKSLEDEHVHDRRRAVETSPLVCYIHVHRQTQTKWHWKSVLRNPETGSRTFEWMLQDWIAFTAWKGQHWIVMPNEREAMMNQAVNQGQYRHEQQVRLCRTLHTLELMERRQSAVF
jgi:hypothetical protein